MKIGEFFFQLGVKADTYTVKDFAKTLMDMPLYAAGAIGALAGVEFGFMALTRHTLNTANSLNMFNAQTGLSTQELQRWQNVAKTVGVEAETVESSITGINNAITRMLRFGDGGAGMALSRLGINANDWYNKTPFEIMSQLRKRYQTSNNKAEFSQLLGQLGVSPDMMRLFQLGPDQFNAAFKRSPIIDNSGLQTMAEFQKSLGELSTIINQELVKVLKEMIPYMGDIAEALASLVSFLGKTTVKAAGGAAKIFNQVKNEGLYNAMTTEGPLTNFGKNLAVTNLQEKAMAGMLTTAVKSGLLAGEKSSYEGMTFPINQNLSITQNIHGVTDGADADSVGSRHMASELIRASKHFGRER